jgi:hypothetical protein
MREEVYILPENGLEFNNPVVGPKKDIADGRLTDRKLSLCIIYFEDMYGTLPMSGEL